MSEYVNVVIDFDLAMARPELQKPYDGLDEFLRKLWHKKMRVVVSTNRDHKVVSDWLKFNGLANLVAEITSTTKQDALAYIDRTDYKTMLHELTAMKALARTKKAHPQIMIDLGADEEGRPPRPDVADVFVVESGERRRRKLKPTE